MPGVRISRVGGGKRPARRALALSLVLLAACLALAGPGLGTRSVAFTSLPPSPAPIGAARVPVEYFRWPVAPFDRAHPIRASFGEPRGLLRLGLNLRGKQRALALRRMDQIAPAGRRVIHTGVDIVAPDLTPVYAVRSGIARTSGAGYGRHVIVGHFGYWHLTDAVATGTHVIALQTVIGRVYPGQGHVHLTRYGPGFRPVNPLGAGGLTPYRDSAPPRIGPLIAYGPRGRRVSTEALRAPVVLAVQAYDVQSLGGLHTGLYRLAWTLYPWRSARPLIGPVEVLRLDALPSPAEGAAMYTLASGRHGLCTRFWYRLSARGPWNDGLFHAERLPAGRYRLVVSASDERGNSARRTFGLRVTQPGASARRPAPRRRRLRPYEHLRCRSLD